MKGTCAIPVLFIIGDPKTYDPISLAFLLVIIPTIAIFILKNFTRIPGGFIRPPPGVTLKNFPYSG